MNFEADASAGPAAALYPIENEILHLNLQPFILKLRISSIEKSTMQKIEFLTQYSGAAGFCANCARLTQIAYVTPLYLMMPPRRI